MNNNAENQECIRLSLPINSAYVSAARLTASSIANRMGFEIDEIEDVKAAVSEACTFIIKTFLPQKDSDFQVVFNMSADTVRITISTGDTLNDFNPDEEMGLIMIKALMDSFEIIQADGTFAINMTKQHQQNLYT